MLNNADKLDSIIEALKDLDRLNTVADILCQAMKALSQIKRVTKEMDQPGEVAPIWPLRGKTRRPEHYPQPVQRKIHLHKHVVQVEVHASREPPEPVVHIIFD